MTTPADTTSQADATFQAGSTLEILAHIIAGSCDCKLREKCVDKTSSDCLKHHNIYAEAMLNHNITQ